MLESLINTLTSAEPIYGNVYQAVLRYVAPLLSAILLLRSVRPLLTFRREPEIWAWLRLKDNRRIPVIHWESVIGRSKRSDVVIDVPTVSRNHAVLTRYDDGSWTIRDAGSKSGVAVNGKEAQISVVTPEDVITIGGVDMTLQPITKKQEIRLSQLRTKAASPGFGIGSCMILTVFQILCCLSYLLCGNAAYAGSYLIGFGGIIAFQWMLLGFYLAVRKPSFEVETLVFFLCTLGMCAISAVKPEEAGKQLLAIGMGIGAYLLVGWSLRDLERAKRIRYLAAAAGIAFLLITLVFGKEYHGAKNWLILGGMSFQPSELSKVCFVYVGASTMDRLVNRRNLILFIGYTIVICACLAVMNDFGTALIFFTAFLLIAYLRSGSVGTIALACTSLGFAGTIAVKIAPHALRRFESWRHIWEQPLTSGHQQTRALMCLASGGFLGLGAGNGWMRNVFASDSDMVFATISEEWGLIMAMMMVFCILVIGLFSIRSAAIERSCFYIIGGCTAAGVLTVQTIFNALGTVDILPLTGVTFPFVSNGGSGMIGAWALLAFVKAADTRQNASFAVKQLQEGREGNE